MSVPSLLYLTSAIHSEWAWISIRFCALHNLTFIPAKVDVRRQTPLLQVPIITHSDKAIAIRMESNTTDSPLMRRNSVDHTQASCSYGSHRLDIWWWKSDSWIGNRFHRIHLLKLFLFLTSDNTIKCFVLFAAESWILASGFSLAELRGVSSNVWPICKVCFKDVIMVFALSRSIRAIVFSRVNVSYFCLNELQVFLRERTSSLSLCISTSGIKGMPTLRSLSINWLSLAKFGDAAAGENLFLSWAFQHLAPFCPLQWYVQSKALSSPRLFFMMHELPLQLLYIFLKFLKTTINVWRVLGSDQLAILRCFHEPSACQHHNLTREHKRHSNRSWDERSLFHCTDTSSSTRQ